MPATAQQRPKPLLHPNISPTTSITSRRRQQNLPSSARSAFEDIRTFRCSFTLYALRTWALPRTSQPWLPSIAAQLSTAMSGPHNMLPPLGNGMASSSPSHLSPLINLANGQNHNSNVAPMLQQPPPGMSTSARPPPPPLDTMRAYRACLHCRNRKSKCDLESNQGRPVSSIYYFVVCLRCFQIGRKHFKSVPLLNLLVKSYSGGEIAYFFTSFSMR